MLESSVLPKKWQQSMESSALVPTPLACGDGCKIASATFTDGADVSSVDLCTASAYYRSPSFDNSPVDFCGLSSDTDCLEKELSVHEAASLLYSLRVDKVENVQRNTRSDSGINCLLLDRQENTCNGVCSCANTTSESQCCNATDCTVIDSTLVLDIADVNTEASLLENSYPNKTQNTDKTRNGAIISQPNGSVAAEDRCRHATSDSDYTAVDCDVVFSGGIEFRPYSCERHLYDIMELVSRDLSEPYSIYTYRYFIYNWPSLCFRVSFCCQSNI